MIPAPMTATLSEWPMPAFLTLRTTQASGSARQIVSNGVPAPVL